MTSGGAETPQAPACAFCAGSRVMGSRDVVAASGGVLWVRQWVRPCDVCADEEIEPIFAPDIKKALAEGGGPNY